MRSRWFTLLAAFVVGLHADASVLVIILDGCRPDYVTAELMPNLHTLGERGVVFEDHHAVFPTVTRVNSPSISTGTYPGTHGLMGNSVYIPEVDAERSLNTSDQSNLQRIDEATGGKLLTTPSMGEILEAHGKSLLAVSSGSSGSAFLLNRTAMGRGIINTGLILPESQRDRVIEILGPVPPDATPSDARNGWVIDAYLHFGLGDEPADLTFMWLTDPDHTAHAKGMGAPETVASLRQVDAQLGRLFAALDERGMSHRVDIIVTSDHGFSTHTGGANLGALLREHEIEAVTAGGAIYLEDKSVIARLVKLLQADTGFGSIYTAPRSPGDVEGRIPGTLSFDAIHWNHERAADVLVSADWTDEEGAPGFRGTTAQGGVAGHGTDSYFDIHGTLIAAGPGFRRGVRSSVPTANVDIAPTVCKLLGFPPPESMQGRAIAEALKDGPDPEDVEVTERYHVVETDGYRLALSQSVVGEHVYFNWTRVDRGGGDLSAEGFRR